MDGVWDRFIEKSLERYQWHGEARLARFVVVLKKVHALERAFPGNKHTDRENVRIGDERLSGPLLAAFGTSFVHSCQFFEAIRNSG